MNKFNFKPEVLFFVGGAAVSLVVATFAKSKCCKSLCVNAVAKGLKLKDNAEHTIASIKEEAEDLYNEKKLLEEEKACCCGSKKEE